MPDKQTTMMTIREVAATGILSEHALRLLVKDGRLPLLYVGKKGWSVLNAAIPMAPRSGIQMIRTARSCGNATASTAPEDVVATIPI